jgi:hypothetical protein
MRRCIHPTVLVLWFVGSIAGSRGARAETQSSSETRPPNVVFLFADDLGYGDLGCDGHPDARTHQIDRPAREGTRFTQFSVTGVTCNPSRTGVMTGLFRHALKSTRPISAWGRA